MQAENYKTPIKGTPFFVVPSFQMLMDRYDRAAYETERIEFVAEGVKGTLSITVENDAVYVSTSFGLARLFDVESGCEPVVIDDHRYSVTLRLPSRPLSEFDFASLFEGELEFSMLDEEKRTKVAGFDFATKVEEDSQLFAETKTRFVRSVLANLRQVAADYPSLGQDFVEAVATAEIARLRAEQRDAWIEMVRRTDEIRTYMKLVPGEAGKLAPEPAWPLSCEETAKTRIGFELEGARMRGIGVSKIEIHQSSISSLVTLDLVDGTSEAHSID
jgi:hypothetical protein|nr:hypothetical protein [Neorhizobium tomejilense]